AAGATRESDHASGDLRLWNLCPQPSARPRRVLGLWRTRFVIAPALGRAVPATNNVHAGTAAGARDRERSRPGHLPVAGRGRPGRLADPATESRTGTPSGPGPAGRLGRICRYR